MDNFLPWPLLRRRHNSAAIAAARLFWITGQDRIRTRDPRALWWGERPPCRSRKA